MSEPLLQVENLVREYTMPREKLSSPPPKVHALNGVSFTKGCYVGQENTARMNYRSKVNRRLVVVRADRAGDRTRIHYPQLGLAVEHRRLEDLGDAIIPTWLEAALSG